MAQKLVFAGIGNQGRAGYESSVIEERRVLSQVTSPFFLPETESVGHYQEL